MTRNLVFYGNSSIDHIINNDEEVITLGGSAVNSAIASSILSSKPAIVSVFGHDFPLSELEQIADLQHSFYSEKSSNQFLIDEDQGTAIRINENYLEFPDIRNRIDCNHLHVSCRAGVDLTNIEESRITFNSLSIDVMYSSVEKKTQEIMMLLPKAKFLFCNLKEYSQLLDLLNPFEFSRDLVLLATSSGGVNIITAYDQKFYEGINEITPRSTSGAGDSFLGAFLSAFTQGYSIEICANYALFVGSLSVTNAGVFHLLDKKVLINEVFSEIIKKKGNVKIPKAIFVIGPSCSGKSTLISVLEQHIGLYEELDDIYSLNELFSIEKLIDQVKRNEINPTRLQVKPFVFFEDVWEAYLREVESFCQIDNKFATPNENGGFDIQNPAIWDEILIRTITNFLSSKKPPAYFLFAFSRGNDHKYSQHYGVTGIDVYRRAFHILQEYIPEWMESSLIIYVNASHEERMIRNRKRRDSGGHFVSEETMETVYKKDLIDYEMESITLNEKEIPIYILNNTESMKENQLNEMLLRNILNSLIYYNNFEHQVEHIL